MEIHDRNDPIIAIATAPGRGAIGIVRISSGFSLKPFITALLGRTLLPRMAQVLKLCDDDGQIIDQVIALYFEGEKSYTGEDVLELQAHGGPVLMQMIISQCMKKAEMIIDDRTREVLLPNLRMARPGEFTERAFLNQKLDLAQAEAVADLIDASTERAVRSANRTMHGVFSNRIQAVLKALIHIRMWVEAILDFPEEEVDLSYQTQLVTQVEDLVRLLLELERDAHHGTLLREGIKAVIAGQPNAGKSSLLNALAGTEVAIVTPIAGTTRDAISQSLQIDGIPLHVVDTAGLRFNGEEQIDQVEAIGIERAWQHIQSADVVLFVHDLTRQNSPIYIEEDKKIEKQLAHLCGENLPLIKVWNKLDAVDGNTIKTTHSLEELYVSAKNREGLDGLRKRLLSVVGIEQIQGEGLFTARQRHVSALKRVSSHLKICQAIFDSEQVLLELVAEELRQAQLALNEITGEFVADDLLGVIFSNFCMGK
jgi:tRNA modification GTPase